MTRKFFWTEHSKIKMRQYGLSKQKLLSIFHKPERREKSIVPGTIAVMRTNKVFAYAPRSINKKKITFAKAWQKPKKAPGEIWIMYKDTKDSLRHGSGHVRKIISAWRYPGVSKPGEEIPIPDDIKIFLLNNKVVQ